MRPREVREDERGAAHEHQNRARGHEEDAQGDMTSHEGPRGGSAPLAASEGREVSPQSSTHVLFTFVLVYGPENHLPALPSDHRRPIGTRARNSAICRCEPSCKARWSSAPTIPAPLTAHHHPSFRQDGCPLHLRFHRQGPRRQGADPCQGVQGLRRRQGVRVRQQVQGEFPRLTSFAGVDINKWRASRLRGVCPSASVESAMPGSQSKRTKRIHGKSPELASSALAVASRAGDPRRARR